MFQFNKFLNIIPVQIKEGIRMVSKHIRAPILSTEAAIITTRTCNQLQGNVLTLVNHRTKFSPSLASSSYQLVSNIHIIYKNKMNF